MKAWHFTADKLRDGRPIPPVGEVLRHDGPVEICATGLHASERIFDALTYAPGHVIHRVECGDIVQAQDDKFVCRERTILWSVDGEDVLCAFARRVALDVIHLWDAPDVVRKYLETGDEKLRDAAWDAARATASAAAWAPAWAAAKDAAWDAARDAARAAARDAAWDAARDAAWDAAKDAAWDKYNTWLTEMVEAAR